MKLYKPDHGVSYDRLRYGEDFESWEQFLKHDSFANPKPPYEFVIGWEWVEADPEEDLLETLGIFYVQPRLSRLAVASIAIKAEDHEAILAWLQKQWTWIQEYWKPVSEG